MVEVDGSASINLQLELESVRNNLKQAQDKVSSWADEIAYELPKIQASRHESNIRHLQEQKLKLQNLLAGKQKDSEQSNQVVQEKCQRLEQLKAALEQLYVCSEQLHDGKAKLETDVQRVQGDVQQIQKDIEAPSEANKKLEYLNKASSMFGDTLGLRFKKTTGNRIQVIFTMIDEKDPLMAFYFFLQLKGKERKYLVSDADPHIDGLEELQAEVNRTNNLRYLMLEMRRKFKATLKNV